MRICVLFFNLGGYHLARLNAASEACRKLGWEFAAIQIAEMTSEHPWGDVLLPDYVTTLLPFQEGTKPLLTDQRLLSDALSRLNPDAVAIPGWGFDFSRTALKWCRLHQKVAVLMSESKFDDAPRVWWKEKMKRFLSVRHFSSSLVGGQKHRDYLRRLGMRDQQIFDGYDIVDNQYFVDRVDRFRTSSNDGDRPECVHGRRYFIAVNRFIARKNLVTLIEAYAEFRSRFLSTTEMDLVLLGDGPQRAELESLVARHNLQHCVHFPGFQTYREICRWYAFADVFVHPALTEQWGLVVNEAMASALPVILSNTCGCYPDLLLDNVSGLSFDPTDRNALADQLRLLAGNEPLRRQMGGAGREHILKNYSPQRFADGLISAVRAAHGNQHSSGTVKA
jgi:glycosyltransferase involved in cell wall biosynthesis